MPHPAGPAPARPSLEYLESRENPSGFVQTFDSVTAPGLPAGWAAWSSDSTTVFTSAAGQGIGGSVGVVSAGSSRTGGRAWDSAVVSGDTGAAASVLLDSSVPSFVFARGTNLNTATPSYLAAVVTRGVNLSVWEVTNGAVKVLGSVASPTASLFSGGWARVSVVPTGNTVAVQVVRQDTGQYLTAQGAWVSGVTNAVSVATTSANAPGSVGLGRGSLYWGPVAMDNFEVIAPPAAASPPVAPPASPPPVVSPPPAVSPPPVVSPPPATPPVVSPPASSPPVVFPPPASPPPASPPPVSPPAAVVQAFDAIAVGATPTGWKGWTTDASATFAAATVQALSPGNGFTSSSKLSTAASRAWADTVLPADATASAAVYLDSLIPAQVFVRGANLDTAKPTYYAVTMTRGLSASLVRVADGVTTTLATVKSASYFSGQWLRVQVTAVGGRLTAQLYRPDTRQWLSAAGAWVGSPDTAFNLTDTAITGGGKAGVGRAAAVSGAVTFDDFTAQAAGATAGPVVSVSASASGPVAGEVTFRAVATGAANRVEFVLNGQVRSSSTTAPAAWTLDTTTLPNGAYTFTARAYDAAGNVGTADYTFTAANPDADPVAKPTIPRHYSHIRIAELAYSGNPMGDFEKNLLKTSVDVVIPNPQYLSGIQTVSPDTPQLIYTNVSNLYQGLLTDWNAYADRAGVSREAAFYHVSQATPFSGASPSSQPVTWFWGVYQSAAAGGAATDVTAAARGGRTTNVSFGAAGQTTAVGFVEKFREINVTLASAATGAWGGRWEYVTAVDAAGNPTAWATLTPTQDGTAGLRQSGAITFDPPADWKAASVGGSDRFYYVRFVTTSGTAAQAPQAKTILGRDYVRAGGAASGMIPAFDYAADKNGDGYLTDAEYATRAAGMDARFVYESRLFYPYYGQMRFVTDPSSPAVRKWAADYHARLLNANPLADGVFIDNAGGKLPFGGVSVLESTATYSADSGALVAAVTRAIAPRWVTANTAGGGANANADAVAAGSAAVFEEFLLRPLDATWSQVGDAAGLVARRLAAAGGPSVIIDSLPTGGSPTDPRTQLATLAYYYLVADPDRTLLMFYGGYNPASSWTEHWSAAAAVNVGKPTGAMQTFATGADPANAALSYKVFSRPYENGLILYKPLSYAQGAGTGTLTDATATTQQLGGNYRQVNADGTLGPVVSSVVLRNGEGAVLIKA